LANLNRRALLSNGGSESEVAEVSRWLNFLLILVAVGASVMAMSLMALSPVVADFLLGTTLALPVYVLGLALSAGIALTVLLYLFLLHQKSR
jgi:hypothetical protein